MKKLLLSLTLITLIFTPSAFADDSSRSLGQPAVFSETAKSTFSCIVLNTHPASEPCRITITTTSHFNRLLVGSLEAKEQSADSAEKKWRLIVGPRDINPAKSQKAPAYLSLVRLIRQKRTVSFQAEGRLVSPVVLQTVLCSTCSIQPIGPKS